MNNLDGPLFPANWGPPSTHIFHHKDHKDPDIIMFQLQIHPAFIIPKDGTWPPLWWLSCHISKNLTSTVTPEILTGQHRTGRTTTCLSRPSTIRSLVSSSFFTIPYSGTEKVQNSHSHNCTNNLWNLLAQEKLNTQQFSFEGQKGSFCQCLVKTKQNLWTKGTLHNFHA